MHFVVPSPEVVQSALKRLSVAQLIELAQRSGVPASTLSKIRNGHTPNPGIQTVRKFFHLLPECSDTQHPEAA